MIYNLICVLATLSVASAFTPVGNVKSSRFVVNIGNVAPTCVCCADYLIILQLHSSLSILVIFLLAIIFHVLGVLSCRSKLKLVNSTCSLMTMYIYSSLPTFPA